MLPDDRKWIESHLRTVVKDYQDFTSATIDSIDHLPSGVEFGKYVASNRPLVIRKRNPSLAISRWTNEYLLETLCETMVSIAVSKGDADSIVSTDEHGDCFVEAATEVMKFGTFLDLLQVAATSPSSSRSSDDSNAKNEAQGSFSSKSSPVYYLQTQNGNLSSELALLAADVGEAPAFAREVFGGDMVSNVWMGNSASVTSLHKDPFENIYSVIRGTKTFHLLPPTEFYCLHERRYPHAQYHLDPAKNKLSIKLVDPPITIPWIPVDPAAFNYDTFPRSQCARPMVVTLEAGDTLYLPALWFHRVAQDVGPSPDRIGVPMAIAVNHWFDMEYSSPLFALSSSLRKLTLALDGIQEDEL